MRTFVTLPDAGLRINLANVVSVEDRAAYTRVLTTEIAHTESGYPCAQAYDLYGDDIAILYRALDRLDVLNAAAATPEGM